MSASIAPLDFALILRSLRRSRARRAIFRALLVLRIASPAELAAQANVTAKHVRGVMIGDMPAFRADLSLVALGLATPRLTRAGAAFECTARADALAELLDERPGWSIARGALAAVES